MKRIYNLKPIVEMLDDWGGSCTEFADEIQKVSDLLIQSSRPNNDIGEFQNPIYQLQVMRDCFRKMDADDKGNV